MGLSGATIPSFTIARISRGLDGEVELYHSRPLKDHYRYLFLDGVVLKSKGAAKVQKKILLCAFGITAEGKQEMIDFHAAAAVFHHLNQNWSLRPIVDFTHKS